MKFGLAIAALTIGCLAQPGNVVFDIFGNEGLGTNNQYQGSGNIWIGDRNKIFGVDNTVDGNDNTVRGENNGVVGGLNNVQGKQNDVTGDNNKVVGEGNIVQGTGNIIATDLNDLGFDIESRLPAWMRSTKPKASDTVAPTVVPPIAVPVVTPVVTPTVQDRAISPQRPVSPRWSHKGRSGSRSVDRFSPRQPTWTPTWVEQGRGTVRPTSPGFRGTGFSRGGDRGFSTSRRPSYREVTHSPGRTEIKQVYETPHGRSEVYRSISRSSGAGGQRTVQSFGGSYNGDWRNQRQDWRTAGPSMRGPSRGRESMRGGRDWNGAGDWNNWNTQGGWDTGSNWNNLRQNNQWADQMRRDAQRSSQQLRARIQNEVQQNLDRAFRNTFY